MGEGVDDEGMEDEQDNEEMWGVDDEGMEEVDNDEIEEETNDDEIEDENYPWPKIVVLPILFLFPFH